MDAAGNHVENGGAGDAFLPCGSIAARSPRSGRPSELEISGAAFDRLPCPVREKIFVCSTPRTGSYLLCRAMIHGGIGIPHEYFHWLHAGIIGPRFGIHALRDGAALQTDQAARRQYIAAILRHRTVSGIFAAKIQWWEHARFLANAEGTALFQGGRFIYLYREGLLDQAISCHVSTQTGRWGFDDTVTTSPPAHPRFLDDRLIRSHIEGIARDDMNWRVFFARNGISPLMISYERLRDDPGGTVRAIGKAFGLCLPVPGFDYEEPAPHEFHDPTVPTKSEIKAQFLRTTQRVKPAP